MSHVNLYDEKSLLKLLKLQKKHNWDLETSFNWDAPIDLEKPLVALDKQAFLFPGASKEQRIVISQMMGLLIASAIASMEDFLIAQEKPCWHDIYQKTPVSPEFVDLGNHFFEEEKKHSLSFKRYIEKFAHQVNVDLDDLQSILPKIENTLAESALMNNLKSGGHAFWWLVVIAEQVFLNIYFNLKPFQKHIEPLYYDLHKKHFEEEAKHAPFPYLLLELLIDRHPHPTNMLHAKADLAFAQLIQTSWTLGALNRIKKVNHLSDKNSFFRVLKDVLPLMDKIGPIKVLWKLLSETPYVSSFVNPGSAKKIQRFAQGYGSVSLPFPVYNPQKLVNY